MFGGRVRFSWGDWSGYDEPHDIRFVNSVYRAGGPLTVRRTVHGIDRRYGLEIKVGDGWVWLGVMMLVGQRQTNEPARVYPKPQ